MEVLTNVGLVSSLFYTIQDIYNEDFNIYIYRVWVFERIFDNIFVFNTIHVNIPFRKISYLSML